MLISGAISSVVCEGVPLFSLSGSDVGWEMRKEFVKGRLNCSADPQLLEIMWIGTPVGTLRGVSGSGEAVLKVRC